QPDQDSTMASGSTVVLKRCAAQTTALLDFRVQVYSKFPFKRRPARLPRSKLASVAFRVSIGSRRRSLPSSSSRSKAFFSRAEGESAEPPAGPALARKNRRWARGRLFLARGRAPGGRGCLGTIILLVKED